MQVRAGCFKNFKGRHAILLDGDAQAFRHLANTLRSLEKPGSQPVELHSLPYWFSYNHVKITAYPSSHERGIRNLAPGLAHFSWEHSEEGWLEAAEKIEGLIKGRGVGHQWLSSIGFEDAVVMVSIGEYNDQWWKEHAALKHEYQ